MNKITIPYSSLEHPVFTFSLMLAKSTSDSLSGLARGHLGIHARRAAISTLCASAQSSVFYRHLQRLCRLAPHACGTCGGFRERSDGALSEFALWVPQFSDHFGASPDWFLRPWILHVHLLARTRTHRHSTQFLFSRMFSDKGALSQDF